MLKSLKLAVVSLFMALFVVACSSSGPENTAKTYLDGLVANDEAKILSVINYDPNKVVESNAAQGKVKMILAQFENSVKKHQGFDKYELSKAAILENQATIKVKMAFKDGTVEVSDLTFEKVNDKWFVKF